MLKITKLTVTETNPFYDPETCHNGGGYSQPSTYAELSDGTTVDIEDSSCGDFGGRIYAVLRKGDNRVTCNYGSMLDTYELDSTISWAEWADVLELIDEELGYRLLTTEELNDIKMEQEEYEYEYEYKYEY